MEGDEGDRFEEALKMLITEEARADTVVRAVLLGVTGESGYVRSAIESLRNRQYYDKAKRLACQIGEPFLLTALEREEKAALGREQDIAFLKRDLDQLETGRQFSRAYKEARTPDDFARVAEQYAGIGMFCEAAEIAEEAGLYERAIELYGRQGGGFHCSAGRIAEERLLDLPRALRHYEKCRSFQSAARVAEKLGDHRRAAAYRWIHVEIVSRLPVL